MTTLIKPIAIFSIFFLIFWLIQKVKEKNFLKNNQNNDASIVPILGGCSCHQK